MKNALILHGTDSNSSDNWFPWLKTELEKLEYKIWVPNLPHAKKPNIKRYNKFILSNKNWKFNNESIIIGHSSGAVAILGLLEVLPEKIVVNKCFLVGSFINDLGWDSLKELFLKPFDFEKIKKHSKEFIFIHSDNDPYCPLDHAKYLAEKLNGKLIIKNGQGHFSGKEIKVPLILDNLK
jgi:uncharacterized protein